MEPLWTKFGEYGLIGIIVGVLFLIVWRMLMWVMAFIKSQEERYAKERECWQEYFRKMNQSLDEHNINAREFHNTVTEAHKFQREEHKEMIGNLKEQGQVLARINGYK